ncbi:MAG: flagellar basal body P-ring formation protein FlgA [Kofleriaceae bacterium]|nr:flagellar basal body P-ring formation protein FlgA [Kofleriaceae bacterium]
MTPSRPVSTASLAAAAALLLAGPVAAEPLPDLVSALASEELPPALAIGALELPRGWAALDVPAEAVSLRWLRAPRAGRVSVRVEVAPTGRAPVRRGWATLTLGQPVDVVVTTRAVAAGEVLGPADLRVDHRVGGARERARLASSPTELVGSVAARDLAAGADVARTAVTLPAPVARGAALRILVARGRLTVSTSGELVAAARPGTTATARLASGASVRGTLIDRTTLAVELP